MAIIDCPQCNKKISDKQKVCPHCELDMNELTDEKLQSLSKIKKLKTNQSIMTQQAIAMILFLAGVLGFYNSNDTQSPQHTAAIASIIVGVLWYLINRFRILWSKRKGK